MDPLTETRVSIERSTATMEACFPRKLSWCRGLLLPAKLNRAAQETFLLAVWFPECAFLSSSLGSAKAPTAASRKNSRYQQPQRSGLEKDLGPGPVPL